MVSKVCILDAQLASPDPDWQTFEDRTSLLFTNEFADTIGRLTQTDRDAAMDRLRGLLGSPEVEVRRRAALTLSTFGSREGVPTMIADLAGATGRDRDNVAVALRISKDSRDIPALRKAHKDPSPYVRGIAASALGEMKAKEALDDLVSLSRDKEGLRGGASDGKLNCMPSCPAFSACYALGALGDARAVPILIDLLSDANLTSPARQALEALTGQRLGSDPARWRAWLDGHGAVR